MDDDTKDDMIAGAVAGAMARMITAPLDVLKIRFQLQFASWKPWWGRCAKRVILPSRS